MLPVWMPRMSAMAATIAGSTARGGKKVRKRASKLTIVHQRFRLPPPCPICWRMREEPLTHRSTRQQPGLKVAFLEKVEITKKKRSLSSVLSVLHQFYECEAFSQRQKRGAAPRWLRSILLASTLPRFFPARSNRRNSSRASTIQPEAGVKKMLLNDRFVFR